MAGLVTGWIVRANFKQPTLQSVSTSPEEPARAYSNGETLELLDDDETRIQMRPIAIGAKPEPTPTPEMEAQIDVYDDEISDEFTEDLEVVEVLPTLPHADYDEITDDVDLGGDVLGKDDTMPFRRPEWDS